MSLPPYLLEGTGRPPEATRVRGIPTLGGVLFCDPLLLDHLFEQVGEPRLKPEVLAHRRLAIRLVGRLAYILGFAFKGDLDRFHVDQAWLYEYPEVFWQE